MIANTASQTIYSNKPVFTHCVEAYDDELRKCEVLLAMGFIRCGDVYLDDRIKYLAKRIKELEKSPKRRR